MTLPELSHGKRVQHVTKRGVDAWGTSGWSGFVKLPKFARLKLYEITNSVDNLSLFQKPFEWCQFRMRAVTRWSMGSTESYIFWLAKGIIFGVNRALFALKVRVWVFTFPHARPVYGVSTPQWLNVKEWTSFQKLFSRARRARKDNIAAWLFENNWSSWQLVPDDKIQKTLLILGRGALSKPGTFLWLAD